MTHYHYFKHKYCLLFFLYFLSYSSTYIVGQTDPSKPNILLIIADDMGVDVMNGYQNSARMPNTPHLDSLRGAGLTFMNAWATPKCTPTRATIMSGLYGIKTGVQNTPGNLNASHTSIFSSLATQTSNAYSDAVIGKWHISQPVDVNHPSELGIDYYAGSFGAMVDNYYNWEKVNDDGSISMETEYATTNLTNEAINWINNQNQPWFLWLAHVAPHTPFHIPPDSMYTSSQTNSNLQKYITMIEAMDYDIGRLMDNIPSAVLNNTVIIFLGDNGTPKGVVQNFPSTHAKGTIYQGGTHVPMVVSGAGVSRQNVKENTLVHATDLYATILEIAGADLPGGVNNSQSFKHLLTNTAGSTRAYNYTELGNDWTIRDAQYKLLEFGDGSQEFYDLIADTLEANNLINSLTTAQSIIITNFETEAAQIRTSWSCQDSIQNGDEEGIDCGGSVCAGCDGSPAPNYCTDDIKIVASEITADIGIYAKEYISSDQPLSADNATFQAGDSIILKAGFEFLATNGTLEITINSCENSGIDDANCPNDSSTSYTNIGCCATPTTANVYSEMISGDTRIINSNNFPNHDYCYNSPSQQPSPGNNDMMMDATPAIANSITSILSNTGRPQRYFGIALNGVIIAPAPATPFIFENTETGEYNWNWVFEPTNNQGSGTDKVGLDCASAHTGPQGYHYHGNPFQYVEGIQTGISTTNTPPASPIQIGWAGDGFPILYRFGPDENGNLKELRPSYQLKYGNRLGDGITAPCGSYNGKYSNDYEYIASTGDLDECNGVTRTITLTTAQGSETFSHFYVVTVDFPQIPRCFVGTHDESFGNLIDKDLETFFNLDSEENETILMTKSKLETINNPNITQNLDLQVMPNPTQNEVFISFNGVKGKNYQIDMLNYQGQKIQQLLLRFIRQNERINTSVQLDIYPAGIYFIRLNEAGNIHIKKIVKH